MWGQGAGNPTCHMDIAIGLREMAGRLHCWFIIWISAEEKIEIAIADRCKIMANHVAYYSRFLPARDEDRDPSFFFEKLT